MTLDLNQTDQGSDLSSTGCKTLDKSIHLSGPQFSSVQSRDDNNTYCARLLGESSELEHVNHWAHSRCAVSTSSIPSLSCLQESKPPEQPSPQAMAVFFLHRETSTKVYTRVQRANKTQPGHPQCSPFSTHSPVRTDSKQTARWPGMIPT